MTEEELRALERQTAAAVEARAYAAAHPQAWWLKPTETPVLKAPAAWRHA